MSIWDVYDRYGNWLGTSAGFTEQEAITNAKAQGMSNAASAERCED